MRPLAAWIMRSRVHAALVGAAFCVFAWLFVPLMPLFSCMSGATAALVLLRHGALEATMVSALGGSILAMASLLIHGGVTPALWAVALIWAPAQLCALVLRNTRNQGPTLVTAALLAALCAGGIRVLTGDAQAWWRQLLDKVAQAAAAGGAGIPGMSAENLDAVAGMLNSLVAASMTVTLMVTVLLARHWQALLYNPGGFGPEFRALQLPRLPALLVSGVLLAVLVLTQQYGVAAAPLGYAVDLLAVSVCALGFHGLAFAHHEVKQRQMAVGWLVGLYGLLLVLPLHVVVTLAAVGLADVIMDFRSRAQASGE